MTAPRGIDRADLVNRFAYHAPVGDKVQRHEEVRSACLTLAGVLNALVPDGREKSLAITALEEVMMWANAGIARSQPQEAK